MIDTRWSLKQRFEYQGQSIAYDVLGEGLPIVLVHGTPFSSYVWRTIARELSRYYKVYLYDLLGYGQSEKQKGQDVSLGVQNDVFVALIDHWNLVTPNVIAHDFGGATVLRAHLINGCDYNKLLLFDAVAVRPWGFAVRAAPPSARRSICGRSGLSPTRHSKCLHPWSHQSRDDGRGIGALHRTMDG